VRVLPLPRGVLLALAAVMATTSCGGESTVARIVNGHDIDGHFITPDAYAEYMDGVLLEEGGNVAGAVAAYERALDEDGDAAEIWARLGRVRCVSEPRRSDDAFRRARSKGPELGAVWRAEAECALDRGDVARARLGAERAAALEPGNAQASLLVIRALERAGDVESATRWLRATRLLFPEAAALPDSLGAAVAANALHPGSSLPSPDAPRPTSEPAAERREGLAALDAALMAGDDAAARSAAVRAHLDNAWLALRAVELGQPAFAKDRAELTLAGEPGNVDARVAALAAADLGGDDAAFRKWATKLPADRGAPSLFAIRVMTALLDRRVGSDVARAFSAAWTERAARREPAPAAPAAR